MTLNALIEALQVLRGDDASGGEGNNGSLQVFSDNGTRLTQVNRAIIAKPTNGNVSEVWLKQ